MIESPPPHAAFGDLFVTDQQAVGPQVDAEVPVNPPWLPVDRGRRPARFLDDLVRTGHADPPQAEADALRRHYAEAVVRG